MTALDPALCARLVSEARSDDERMTPAPSWLGYLLGHRMVCVDLEWYSMPSWIRED